MTDGSPGARLGHRRWSVGDVLLAVAFVALWALIALTDQPPWVDRRVVEALPPLSGSGSIAALSWPARLVTDVGEPTTWTIVTLVLAMCLGWSWRSWEPLRLVAVPVLVEAAIVLTLKAVVHRSGPEEPHPRFFGYFPSGHTATALVCTGALATLLAVWRPEWGRRLRVAVVGWALLMGASLIYYRYHWLTDVVGSLLLGLLILRLFCRPLWAAADGEAASGDDSTAEDDALRLAEDA